MQVQQRQIVLETTTGPMQTWIVEPINANRKFTAILFYSEIFQITAPILRAATLLAGQGFIVLLPEVFHEFNPAGTVLGYDDIGKDKGNQDKWQKPLAWHDSDTQAMLDYLQGLPHWNGQTCSYGVCIGGHLAFRAALNPAIRAACCLYATDLHSDTLPAEPHQQTLARAAEIKAELCMIWGKQDPHIPSAGRQKIYQALTEAGCSFSWHEVNAQHAFMRDEGERYDPALALWVYQTAIRLFA